MFNTIRLYIGKRILSGDAVILPETFIFLRTDVIQSLRRLLTLQFMRYNPNLRTNNSFWYYVQRNRFNAAGTLPYFYNSTN